MNPKRKQATDHILKHIRTMEPSGYNEKRYQKMFDSMSDEDFDQFMQNLRDKKTKLTLFAPNMKINLRIENLQKAADDLDLKLFERLHLYDDVTKKRYLTTHEYLVVRLPVRRARQFLMHKLSVPDSDRKLDALTGQVTQDDKASSLSFVEAQLLYARGLDKVLHEFVKVRGGDIHALANFKQQLEEGGSGRLSALDDSTVPRSTIVMSTILKCMLLDNNLVENL